MSTEVVAVRMGAGDYALPLERAALWAGMEKALERAHFLGQFAHESGGFRPAVAENLNYSAKRMAEVWSSRYATPETRLLPVAQRQPTDRARQLAAAGPEAIANDVYGGRMGNVFPGDGWRYRGRGPQLTGRDNYTRASRALYGDDRLVVDPDLVLRADVAAGVAAWYWRDNHIQPWALADDVLAVSRAINLGNPRSAATPIGMPDRIARTEQAKRLFAELTA